MKNSESGLDSNPPVFSISIDDKLAVILHSFVKAKFHYASWFGAGSKQTA